MKIRTDFVSNSSSSSFIIQDAGFFEYFGITIDDINEALIELTGGREHHNKLIEEYIAKYDDLFMHADNDDIRNSCVKYKNNILKNGTTSWRIYDMTNDDQRKACYEEWSEFFRYWIAPSKGDVEKWNAFEDIVRYKLNCNLDVTALDDNVNELQYYDHKTQQYHLLPAGSKAFCKLVKDKLGVQTMEDVLHDHKTTMMIHFNDNEVYNINGMCDDEDEDDKQHRWESEAYTKDRFFEILIKHLVKKGKVDLSNKGFMEYWLVPRDHWWKNDAKYKNRKYFLDSDKTATWKDVVYDMLNDNSILHEG